jgi:RNA polymerase sigma factor (sigma-70 family)
MRAISPATTTILVDEPLPGKDERSVVQKSLAGVMEHVRKVAAVHTSRRLSDRELIDCFLGSDDEAAFTALVERHGPMVHGVCCRLLRNTHDADDACQATFLVLAKKASSLRKKQSLGSWLHGIASRIAANMKRANARRLRREQGAARPASASNEPGANWQDILAMLDKELQRLPECYRGPLILCYLEGKDRNEAAERLGLSVGTLHGRLERGRNLLRQGLVRRGLTLSTGLLAVVLGEGPAQAALSPSAVIVTTRAALAYACGGSSAAGLAPPMVLSLATEALKTMALTKLATAAFAAGLIACGIAFTAFGGSACEKASMPENSPVAASAEDERLHADEPSEALPAAAVARLGSDRLRTGGSVQRMSFSPNGTKLASWGSDSHTNDTLVIWDTKSGRAIRRVDLPGARVDLLVWLADGRGFALVQGSSDESVPFLWEFTDEKAEKPKIAKRAVGGGTFAIDPANQPPMDNEYDSCYAISPDGKSVAIGRAGELPRDREVRLCELKAGAKVDALKTVKTIAKHPGPCGELHFSPDGKTLVVFTRPEFLANDKFEDEQLVSVWDVASAKSKAQFKAPRPATNGRSAVAVSNTTLAIGLEKGDTSLWDLAAGKERKLATGHDSKKNGKGFGTYSLAFTPDGDTLATGGRDQVTKLWDVRTGKLLQTLAGHHRWVDVLAVAPGGKLLASAAAGMIRLWDPTTGADACPLPGHKFAVGSVAFSSDDKIAVTGGWDDTIRWWDVDTGAERRIVAVPDGVLSLTQSPDGKTVLVATDDGKLRTWDVGNGRENTPANLPVDVKFGSFSVTPDRKYLVAGSGPKVTIWEWPGMKPVRTIQLPPPVPHNPPDNSESRCQVAAVSPNGKWLVTVAYTYWFREQDGLVFGYASEGMVDLWDFASGERIRRLAELDKVCQSGMFTADGLFILVGAGGKIPRSVGRDEESFDGEINLLDPIAAHRVRSFDVPPVPNSVALRYSGSSTLSPDGRTLYVAYNTGEIIAFEVATGKPRRTLTGHQGYIGGLAISADGRRLISGGADGVAIVWDATPVGVASPRSKALTEAGAEKLWEAMGQEDARVAFTALGDLSASPDRAAEFLGKHLKPALAAPSEAVLNRIFSDLDSDKFATREKASKELDDYGESAVPGVRKKLAGNASSEVKSRATEFLKPFDKGVLTAKRVRQMRAVELLEGLATPAARKILTEVAAGATGAPLTLDAVSALKRLRSP